jgi:triacylglycerol lipase
MRQLALQASSIENKHRSSGSFTLTGSVMLRIVQGLKADDFRITIIIWITTMKLSLRLISICTLSTLAIGSNFANAGKPGSGGGGTSTCAAEPIVMIHGYMGSTSNFNTMETRLKDSGQPTCALYKFGYNSTGDSNKTSARKLRSFVDSVLNSTGQSKARLIAHSNGGLVSRWYRVYEGGSKKTSRLITLGTPHEGTSWAYACYSPACFEMRPNSSLLQDLGGRGCDVSLWSDADEIILPNSSAKCGNSIQTKSVSHNGMLSDADVFVDVNNNL